MRECANVLVKTNKTTKTEYKQRNRIELNNIL